MSIEYIRDTYRVPAKKDGRVRYTGGGAPQLGTIIGSRNAHLCIKMDDGEAGLYHPTWEMEYLPEDPAMTTNKPKERPILFNAEMVRAILDGRKTQTRRIIKPQPVWDTDFTGKEGLVLGENVWSPDEYANYATCPFGQTGDRLWVRETWRTGWIYGGHCPAVQYRATETAYAGSKEYPVLDVLRGEFGIPDPAPHSIVPGGKWKPSIHMPRWASRITLEITGVRVERLQNISEGDARAEGVQEMRGGYWRNYQPGWTQHQLSAKDSFATLWGSINGPDSWDANPWVWVVEFRRVDQ